MKVEDILLDNPYMLIELNRTARLQNRWHMATVKNDIDRDGLICVFCSGVAFYLAGDRFGYGCMNQTCLANIFAAIHILGKK